MGVSHLFQFFVTEMTRHPKRPAPLSLRLTPEDRRQLERDAAGMSLGSYIRWRLFDPDQPPPRQRSKTPIKDHRLLSEVVAKFRQSHIASNLNQLARAANSGSLLLTSEVESELREAIQHVAGLRRLLIAALDLCKCDRDEQSKSARKTELVQSFRPRSA